MGSPGGMWTSVSGAAAQSQNVDTIANNLANANTVGFKKDAAVFKEYLTTYERQIDPAIDIPRTVFKDSDFYHHDGKEHAFVNVDRVQTDHTQGSFKPTGGAFDMAVDGPGFFAVKVGNEVAFTRAGDFKINGEGKLVTSDGNPVLVFAPGALEQLKASQAAAEAALQQQAANGTPAAPTRAPASVNPFSIKPPQTAGEPAQPGQSSLLQELSLSDVLTAGKKIQITGDGKVYSGSDELGTLAVAEFSDARLLQKTGSTLYLNSNPANVPKAGEKSLVRQGFLEQSNVNAASELMELLKANRMFESNMRAIKAYGEMSAKEANEVGKL